MKFDEQILNAARPQNAAYPFQAALLFVVVFASANHRQSWTKLGLEGEQFYFFNDKALHYSRL